MSIGPVEVEARKKKQERYCVSDGANSQPMESSAIRAVILDYGDVISLPANPAVIAEMARTFQLSEERFRQLYGSFRLDYDRGALDAREYWSLIARAAGVELGDDQVAALRRADVAMWSRLNEPVLLWAGELRAAGFKTAVLSNMHDDMVQHLRQNGAWTKSFDCLTLSSAIRMAKPDAHIFKHCLNCLRLAPHETLFVDDRENNVRAAQSQGMQAIVAPTTVDLRSQLEAIGFAPLPD
jgi:putative hydrolase of the HAD superfamily